MPQKLFRLAEKVHFSAMLSKHDGIGELLLNVAFAGKNYIALCKKYGKNDAVSFLFATDWENRC